MIYNDTIYRLCEKLHWMQISKEDGVLEFYLDNHMLQNFRQCEAFFFESFVEGYHGTGYVWFLDLGVAAHTCIEEYYKEYKKSNFNMLVWATQFAREVWDKQKMEEKYSGDGYWAARKSNEYKNLGGFLGFSSLLIQYASHFRAENDRFRVIGTELYFGKNKEVPLYDETYESRLKSATYTSNHSGLLPFRLYLAGKIDLLIDDGRSIGPMDHKTAGNFMGKNPVKNYEIQDGMTGYVFAAKQILKNFWDQEYIDKVTGTKNIIPASRQVNKIWMNFLQIKPEEDISKRFKRIPIYKTDWELEEYRQRQISTVARLYQLLENYREDGTGLRPYFNDRACTNWMHQTCTFAGAHHQKDRESQLIILNRAAA